MLEENKSELISSLCSYAESRAVKGPDGVDLRAVLKHFYRHVAPEDLLERESSDLYGAVMAELRLAADRPQGKAAVKVFTPSVSGNGWSAGGHTVVEVVTDDMPFLVDSVSMVLSESQHDVHLVVHPQYVVRRDMVGALQEVLDEQAATDEHDVVRESWMHLEIDRVADEELADIQDQLTKVLTDVRDAVEDWTRMHTQVDLIVQDIEEHPPPLPAEELEQGVELLRWLTENHFTFLGYREYALEQRDGDEVLVAVPGTGFGILRADPLAPRVLPEAVADRARDKHLLVLAKANSRATVHRPVFLDYVGVKKFDESGEVVGERRFLGLFSSAAYTESVRRIPVLREKADAVMDAVGLDPMSHAGKAMMDVLETYPRDELFQTPVEDLVPIASQVMYTRERRQLKLFVRRDIYGRFLSCLVYLPRDRYNTSVRERIAAILKTQLGGDSIEWTAHVGESFAARLHFVVRPREGERIGEPDVADLERRCAEAARSWRDDFVNAVISTYGEEQGSRLVRTYASCWPEAYKEDYPPQTGGDRPRPARGDRGRRGPDALALRGRRGPARRGAAEGLPDRATAVAVGGAADPLDHGRRGRRRAALPARGSRAGVPHLRLRPALPPADARPGPRPVPGHRQGGLGGTQRERRLQRARPGRRASTGVRRWCCAPTPSTCARAAPPSPRTTSRTRCAATSTSPATSCSSSRRASTPAARGPRAAGSIPADSEARQAKCSDLEERVLRALDEVQQPRPRPDPALLPDLHPRHAAHELLRRPVPTAGRSTGSRSSWSRRRSPTCPRPGPSSRSSCTRPRVEGVHLRFGAVARGGLRWSDRRDDFRTEVLGLVKAQMVKNTVIVPVGAKGGFFCKQLPDASDRDAWMAEGIACYKTFISGLLDLTDNLVDGPEGRAGGAAAVRRAPRRRRPLPRGRGRQGHGHLQRHRQRRLARLRLLARRRVRVGRLGRLRPQGDGHHGPRAPGSRCAATSASGASTARPRTSPASASVTCPVTSSATGCCAPSTSAWWRRSTTATSSSTRSPTPRRRTPSGGGSSTCPRSSWQDYDTSLISAGGGVWPRSAKSIPVSPQMREALGLDPGVQRMTPAELMRAILLAPVDLLWNGGIGTYVKVEHRDQRRRGRQGQRRHPRRRRATCGWAAWGRAATSASPSSAASSTPAPGAGGRVAGSTPTSSTTPRASTPPTAR